MNHIKNVAHLYKLDWKRIFKNPMATFLIIALMILPSLYAWFNIKALWDPYANTGDLPIAVYSADAGASFQGKEIAIGDQVLDNLHKNKQLGWKFVDSKKAVTEGVKSGKYYAGIYLPKDFSENLLSFTTGEINKPKIEYYINEKINAIAPKITDKGASSLQETISQQFIETASSTLMKAFNEVGYDIDTNLVSINKVKNLILETDANIETIDGYTKEVVELNEKMPEIKEKVKKADEFLDYIPKVDELGNKLVTLNEKMPELKKQASIILTLKDKLPEIQKAGEQLAMVDEDFDKIEETMNSGIADAKQGLQVIDQVEGLLPDIEKLGSNADSMASQLTAGAEKMKDVVPTISNNVGIILQSMQSINTQVIALNNKLQDVNSLTDDERKAIVAELNRLAENLGDQVTFNNELIELIQGLPNYDEKPSLQDLVNHLQNINALLPGLQNKVSSLATAVQNKDQTTVSKILGEVTTIATQINSILGQINVNTIKNDLNSVLDKTIAALTNAQDAIKKAQQIDLASLLANTKKTVANAVTLLEKYQKEMPAIKQEVHSANTLLNGHMDEIVNGINKGVDLYNNDLPVLEAKLKLAVNFYQNDWPSVKTQLTDTFKMVNDKLPQVESALAMATDLIQNDWPTLKAGLHKAATAIEKGESQVDLGEIIKLLKLDANKESDFFTNPVELKTNQMYPIANNGSASTPFYTALCLWVGALLLSSVAVTDVYLEEKDKNKFSKREKFVARMLTFLTEAIFQALIVTLGNYFLLGVDVRQPFYSVLFALLVGLAFMTIVYVLAALFGNIGKGIAIIILVLSISGGGGNYPIQVSSKFFQVINPLLPFTHAVNLLREAAGGIYWPNAVPNILLMVGLIVGFSVVGTLAYPYLEGLTKKLAKVSKDSHFFH